MKVINNIAPYTFAVEIAADEDIIQINFANIRKIIEDIRPAHLAFLTSVCFLIEILCKIDYRSELILETEYAIFPKILKSHLDGIIKMNAPHRLNSYKEKKIFELYQSKLDLETTLQSIIWSESRCELGDKYQIKEIYTTAINFVTENCTEISYVTNIELESNAAEKIKLEYSCGLIVEKQRIQMNGIKRMNGTGKMKREVIYYDKI